METKTLEVRKISVAEWMAEGKELFGENAQHWKFVCSNCGHEQSINDFVLLRDLKLFDGDPQVAYFSCIGRFDPRIPRSRIGTLGDGKEYCDYTLGGLISLGKTIVIGDEGNENQVFEFVEA